MLKHSLRQHLGKIYPNHELQQWFDPLAMEVDRDDGEVRVFFPHDLFARWFLSSDRRAEFERHARRHWNRFSLRYMTGAAQADISRPENTDSMPVNPSLLRCAAPSEHTFASFLSNRKNDFPLAAARECVAKAPAPPFFSLAIYGQSGSGKTHLLGATANALQAGHPDMTVFYGPFEDFFSLLFESDPGRVRQVDAFFIDDLHRLQESRRFQEDFCTFFDALRADKKLIVLTLDRHPAVCEHLHPKVRLRLSSGLLVELKKPDIDIRRQYVQQKNAEYELNLGKEDILLLAQRYHDFRSMDGMLNRVRAYRNMLVKRPGRLAEILDPVSEQTVLTPEEIVRTVATHFSLNPEDVRGTSRNRRVMLARQIAVFLCRDLLGLSLSQVGRIFGGRDHSSILYTIKKIKELQLSNNDMHSLVSRLKKLCLSRL